MKIVVRIVVDVDDAGLEKLNAKRVRLGRQTTSAIEEVDNTISGALMTHPLFDIIEIEKVVGQK